MSVPCKYCGSLSHTSFYCRMKKRKPIPVYKRLKPSGKITKQWLKTRQTWFSRNPAEYYTCYLCGRVLTKQQTTLDHIRSRSRHPELRFVLSNLAPCCYACNEKKGSRDIL